MMCTRCHKRPATVFVSQAMDSKEIKGYCFVCAKELGIQPVNDFMNNMMSSLKEQTGMSEEEFAEATEQMAQMLGMTGGDGEEQGEETSLFTPGGAQTLPAEMMLGGAPGENGGRTQRTAPSPVPIIWISLAGISPSWPGPDGWTLLSAGKRRSSG